MSEHQFPQQRDRASPDSFVYKANLSGSSSVESLRRAVPHTPPPAQLSLGPIAMSDTPVFSNFFPWIKQNEDPLDCFEGTGSIAAADDHAMTVNSTPKSALEAFQQRDAAYLPKTSLHSPVMLMSELQNNPLGLPQDSNLIRATERMSRPVIDGLPSSSNGYISHSAGIVAHSSATSHADSVESPVRTSPDITGSLGESTETPPSVAFDLDLEQPLMQQFGTRFSLGPSTAFPLPAPCLSRTSAAQDSSQLQGDESRQPGSSCMQWPIEVIEEQCQEDGVVLDIFEDDTLPGYQVWKRGSTRSTAMAVRIPRQMVGWKAVLMDAGGFGDEAFSSATTTKNTRRASKVLGKQGWEVRQEALKNSYDFRRGSGIWATMHAGHRLFKHDWHLIIKDGSRYMWKMDKHALALYRDEGDVKIAEFRRAVPSSAPGSESMSKGAGYLPDMTKRIGSFKYEPCSSLDQAGTIFDMELALISLMAVFGARGGHRNVSAAFEPSSDPLHRLLEERRRETPDREEVMLALPRPGFARDDESVLSDTTDEDDGPRSSGVRSPRPVPAVHDFQSPAMAMPGRQLKRWRKDQSAVPTPRTSGGRKRLSSFFGTSNTTSQCTDETEVEASNGPMTDAQRIARQYRSTSMFLGG